MDVDLRNYTLNESSEQGLLDDAGSLHEAVKDHLHLEFKVDKFDENTFPWDSSNGEKDCEEISTKESLELLVPSSINEEIKQNISTCLPDLNSNPQQCKMEIKTESLKDNLIKQEPAETCIVAIKSFTTRNIEGEEKAIIQDLRYKENTLENKNPRQKHDNLGYMNDASHIPMETPTNNKISNSYDGGYKCDFCGEIFSNKLSLKNHVRIHLKNKLHICSECRNTFFRESDLKRHLVTHSSVKTYRCNHCTNTYPLKVYLSRHLQIHSNATTVHHLCEHCNRAFSRKGDLNNHLLTHTGLKLNNLEHLCNYNGSDLHICGDCGKTFVNNYNLKRHFITHTAEKPFLCAHCDRSFSEKGQLKKHLFTHSGMNSFRCKICHKSYFSNNNLKRHSLKHTGSDIHICIHCSAAFSSLSLLTTHLLNHRQLEPQICGRCSKTFFVHHVCA